MKVKRIKIPRSIWVKTILNKNYGKYDISPMPLPTEFLAYAVPIYIKRK